MLTPSFSPICRTSTSLPLKANDEVREATCMPGTLASALMISSVMPSLKYSFSGSALMLASGSTAIALRAAERAAFCRPDGEPGRACARSMTGRSASANSAPVANRSAGVRASARVERSVDRLGHVAGDPHASERATRTASR